MQAETIFALVSALTLTVGVATGAGEQRQLNTVVFSAGRYFCCF